MRYRWVLNAALKPTDVGTVNTCKANTRTILRGLVVLKLLAFTDEGASACGVESAAVAGGARPFAGKSRGRWALS